MPDENVETPEVTTPAIDPSAHANLMLENALLRAGVDLESEQGQLIADANRGKETVDVEAIKRQWELVKPNPVTEPAEVVEPRIEGEADQGAERRGLAATAVVEPNPMDNDPREAAIEAGRNVIAPLNGGHPGSREDAQATTLHNLLEAAERGDARVFAVNGSPD